MDASGSIGRRNWDTFIEFIIDVIRGFDIGRNEVHIGVVKFDRIATIEINIDQFSDMNSLIRAVRQIEYTGRETNIADGLRKAREDFVQRGRQNVPRVAVLFTDGEATEETDRTVPEANRLKAERVRLSTVGVTNNVDEEQLRGIATDGRDTILATDFNDLRNLLRDVQEVACPPRNDFILYVNWEVFSVGGGWWKSVITKMGSLCGAVRRHLLNTALPLGGS